MLLKVRCKQYKHPMKQPIAKAALLSRDVQQSGCTQIALVDQTYYSRCNFLSKSGYSSISELRSESSAIFYPQFSR